MTEPDDEIIDATPAQVIDVITQMIDRPWPDGDGWLEWTIDGIDGHTSWFAHVLPLGATSEARGLADLVSGVAGAAKQRWGEPHRFDATQFTDDRETDRRSYDRRSAPAGVVRSLGARRASWWRLGSDAVMLVHRKHARPQRTAAVLVLPAQWLEGPGAEEAALQAPLTEAFLSGENRRVLHAVWAVIASRDPELLAPLVTALPAIEKATADLDLGGALLSNRNNLDHALDRIRLFADKRCLCQAYPDHVRYEPAKEEARGHVRILEEIPTFFNGRPDRPERICECTDCGRRFSVEEGEYHYTWWKWTMQDSGR
ncbi:hypothetical protein [Pseudactinotalea sp.]|uniref:hypothetical protein n=1 Tax=Pseudactinotalea sp. TaxID=1926260 RepID=UPI003B3A24C6